MSMVSAGRNTSPTCESSDARFESCMRFRIARGCKSRPRFSPRGGVESTAPNFVQPLRKRVADMKHGFESRWSHHLNYAYLAANDFHPLPLGSVLQPGSIES